MAGMTVASCTSAWLSVIVKKAERVVKGREILKCSWEDTYGSLLLKLRMEKETISYIVISRTEKFCDPCHKVPVDAPVILCEQFNCMHVCIYLEAEASTVTPPARTVNSVLMENSLQIVLPNSVVVPEGRPLRADQRLRNDLISKLFLSLMLCLST